MNFSNSFVKINILGIRVINKKRFKSEKESCVLIIWTLWCRVTWPSLRVESCHAYPNRNLPGVLFRVSKVSGQFWPDLLMPLEFLSDHDFFHGVLCLIESSPCWRVFSIKYIYIWKMIFYIYTNRREYCQ